MTAVYSLYCVQIKEILWLDAMLLLLLLVYSCDEIFENIRRKKWKNKFIPYRISDEFVSQSTYVLVAIVILLPVACVYAYSLEESKEAHVQYTDVLFDGIDNMSADLSYSDCKTVNEMRREYLQNFFSDNLKDTICDNRELQYARVLYNLQEPDSSIMFLYPNRMWTDHLFWILSTEACGMYDEANRALQLYVEGSRFDAINNNITALDLIWIAEKYGDFESAKTLYEYVEENKDSLNCITSDVAPSYYLNYGHIYLYNGDFKKAQELYKDALELSREINYVDTSGYNLLLNHLISDLHIFSRFNAIPDSTLQMAANIMDVEFKPAFVPISCVDSTESAEIYKYLEGNWVCQDGDSRIELHMDENYHLFTYTWFNEKGEEFYKTLAELRIGRMNNELYWDEFGTTTDSNSFSKIISLDDDCFVLEIIENGNPSDKGKLRKYERVE